jgi:hypothetical protein
MYNSIDFNFFKFIFDLSLCVTNTLLFNSIAFKILEPINPVAPVNNILGTFFYNFF